MKIVKAIYNMEGSYWMKKVKSWNEMKIVYMRHADNDFQHITMWIQAIDERKKVALNNKPTL